MNESKKKDEMAAAAYRVEGRLSVLYIDPFAVWKTNIRIYMEIMVQ
jgi:hypothetical protein